MSSFDAIKQFVWFLKPTRRKQEDVSIDTLRAGAKHGWQTFNEAIILSWANNVYASLIKQLITAAGILQKKLKITSYQLSVPDFRVFLVPTTSVMTPKAIMHDKRHLTPTPTPTFPYNKAMEIISLIGKNGSYSL